MSVLRKASLWGAPTLALLGALTLGLAGCGGGDDSGFPSPEEPPIVIPGNVVIVVPEADRPTPVVRGQGATVETPPLNTQETRGVQSVVVTIPPGAIQENTTLGVEVVPSAQSVIEQIRNTNPQQVTNRQAVAEIAFGSVDAQGRIDVNRPIVFAAGSAPATVRITLSPAQAQQLQQTLGNGNAQFEISTVDAATQTVQTIDCQASFANGVVTLTGTECATSGRIILEVIVQHQQGGTGSPR